MKVRNYAGAAALVAVSLTGVIAAPAGATDRGADRGAGTYERKSRSPRPETIALPDGWRPEGIAAGRGSTFYVGSIPTGAIFKGDVRTGEGDVLVPPQTGRAAIGVAFDARGNRLFVAGGGTGKAFVYDAETGAALAEYVLTTATPTFVNDVVVARDSVWLTDSQQAQLYQLPLKGGKLPVQADVKTVPVPDTPYTTGNNLNGVEAVLGGGKWLIAVQSNVGKLWLIDATSGKATAIDLGGDTVVNGDGLLVRGRTLYVMQNRDNKIAVVRLSEDYKRGTIVDYITDADFDVPSTIDIIGGAIYAVNARFGVASPDTASYAVVKAG
ncbi:MAG: superoxide dismutase [Acidimicrobiia bacterium]